jgi:hypothetical protein
MHGTAIAAECRTEFLCIKTRVTGENRMLRSIFNDQGTPMERPLHLSGASREMPTNVIRRNPRRDPSLVQPGDEIYDRARVIFSRAKRPRMARSSSII